MQQQNKIFGAFTLVELIVVITIVGILSTVGFVSYSGYLSGARDSSRISQMVKLSDSLQVYSTTKLLPLPDNYVEVTASGTIIGYQGEVGIDVLETIDYTNGGTDPKDDSYYSYYLTKNRKSMQIMALMEEQTLTAQIYTSYAADYSNRYPKVYGRKLGIFTEVNTNTPIHQLTTYSTTPFDVVNETGEFISHISDEEKISGTGSALQESIINGSCKRIKQTGGVSGNGIYTINPGGTGNLTVYCEMETAGGGWTLVHKSTDSIDNLVGRLDTNEGRASWDNNEEYRLSINYWKGLSTQAVMAKNIRIDGLEWEDKVDGVIVDISTSSVEFSTEDIYRMFNMGTINDPATSSGSTFGNTAYWNIDAVCNRCANVDNIPLTGASEQPRLHVDYASTSENGLEGAGGTDDLYYHTLSKMGIFIK